VKIQLEQKTLICIISRFLNGSTIGLSQYAADGSKKVQGYVLVQGILQWPHLNTNAETFADVLVYKAMALLDTFPAGDPEVLISFLEALYPDAPFAHQSLCLTSRNGKHLVSSKYHSE
jgi:hypothetical protein